MQKKYLFCILLLLSTGVYAQQTTLHTSFEILEFDHSKKKDAGKRYGIGIEHQQDKSKYQLAYERTNTDTFQPPLTEDLHVNKYYLKYSYKLDQKQSFSISYATLEDNLMKETDGGHIYGVGYGYGPVKLTQYISDYKHFDVYQTDFMYHIEHYFSGAKAKFTWMAKYIHLSNKDSNNFSKNAQEDYLTPGIKIHAHHHGYHVGAGAFFGKRIFAVMNDGFGVQHHAMEFKETYMIGGGKSFGDISLKLRYVYQKANEVPIQNDNVTVQNITLQLSYQF